jgi:hypothetical protein
LAVFAYAFLSTGKGTWLFIWSTQASYKVVHVLISSSFPISNPLFFYLALPIWFPWQPILLVVSGKYPTDFMLFVSYGDTIDYFIN